MALSGNFWFRRYLERLWPVDSLKRFLTFSYVEQKEYLEYSNFKLKLVGCGITVVTTLTWIGRRNRNTTHLYSSTPYFSTEYSYRRVSCSELPKTLFVVGCHKINKILPNIAYSHTKHGIEFNWASEVLTSVAFQWLWLNVLDTMRHRSLANVNSCWVSILFLNTTESRRVRGGGMEDYGIEIKRRHRLLVRLWRIS